LSQIHALRLVRSLEPGLGDMSSGAWRLLGLACTLAALFLVNWDETHPSTAEIPEAGHSQPVRHVDLAQRLNLCALRGV